tara:strand:- start:1844 stop:2929 length:1086 start_codon:yes stop_codon:yes gene_type:complete
MWKVYVETVSNLSMAGSLQTCAYLAWLVATRKPARILDLGSGISSAVLRLSGAEVVSVDDDEGWMDRTRAFLSEWEIDDSNLIALDDLEAFDAGQPGRYGLVFHDLGGGETRNRLTDYAFQMVADDGVIVLDDAHHPSHLAAYAAAAEAHGFTLYSLADRTEDAIMRHSVIGVREPVTNPSQLADQYHELCATPSDIYLHLPRMVELVYALNAQHVIELGTRTGVSTIAWLHGLHHTGGRLTSVDIDERPPIGEYDRWEFIQGDDCDPAVIAQLEPADIVFIDTSHLYEHTVRELDAYRHLVKPGGAICLHDTELAQPEGAPARPLYPVKKAVKEFVAETGWRWVNIPECYGFGVIGVPKG